MIPNTVNLPTIWRGCDWGPVELRWKNPDGTPINLTPVQGLVWTPKAHSLHVNLHASVTNAAQGITHMILDRDLTINLRLGVEKWDWVWERLTVAHPIQVRYRFPPFLSGKITIKDPVSSVGGDTPPDIPDEIETPPTNGGDPPEFVIDVPPDFPV